MMIAGGWFWFGQIRDRAGQVPPAPAVSSPPVSLPSAVDPELMFTDVTAAAGLRFTHISGATGQRWYPETIGSGVAFFDYDGDAKPDILLVNGQDWPPASGPPATLQLYRNNGAGGFENVTESAGLAVLLYGMGVAVGDYDNDGDRDVFVSGYRRHLFFVNQGNGTFADATQQVGIGDDTWGAGAAFFDYDRDGWLDLVLASYVTWSPELEAGLDCSYGTPNKDYCPVRYFKGEGLSLYRNQGDGTFRDVTGAAGVASPGTRAFAPAIFDFDDDGWLDIFVASDGTPSRLWRNLGDGTFVDVGVQTGIVLDESGAAYAGMGIDFTFPRNDDQLCVTIGNFVGEPTTMHCRVPQGDAGFHPELYAEMSARTGVGRRTLQSVTFGLFFFDADLDGFQDLFMVNGHVVDEARLRNAPRAQRPQLFRNLGTGRFQEITAPPGSGLDRHLVGRGAAYADYDGDGDLDIVVQQNQGAALLLRNDLALQHHFLRVQLTGTKSNRDGIGADVRVYTDAGRQRQMLRTGVSYLSQSDFPLLFGLRTATTVKRIEIVWPSGMTDVYRDVPVDTTLNAVEGRSQLAATPAPVGESRDQTPDADTQDQAFPAYVRAGIEAYRQGDYAAAAKAFEAAIPLRPDEPTPYRYLADLYWRQGQHVQAEEAVRQLSQAMPDAYFLDRQGSGYESSELLGLAQLLYLEAVRLDAAFPSARFNLGRTYLEQGDTARGIEEIQAAIRLHPEFAEAHETLGLAYIEQSHWEAAIRHLVRALAWRKGVTRRRLVNFANWSSTIPSSLRRGTISRWLTPDMANRRKLCSSFGPRFGYNRISMLPVWILRHWLRTWGVIRRRLTCWRGCWRLPARRCRLIRSRCVGGLPFGPRLSGRAAIARSHHGVAAGAASAAESRRRPRVSRIDLLSPRGIRPGLASCSPGGGVGRSGGGTDCGVAPGVVRASVAYAIRTNYTLITMILVNRIHKFEHSNHGIFVEVVKPYDDTPNRDRCP